jgi:chromosome segregation ATPase
MAEEIIIKIDLNKAESEKKLREVEKQLREYKKQLSETEKAIKENQKAQEDLIKAGAKSEQATAEQIAALKALENEYDKLIDTQINETAQVKASADEKRRLIKEIDVESNSINALRSTIAKLTAERNNLDTQSLEGQKRFQELTDQLKEYNEQLNDASKAAGSFKDNIGNYKESVKEALQETDLFNLAGGGLGGTLKGLATEGFGFVKNAIDGLIPTIKALGVALLTNPIFLIGYGFDISNLHLTKKTNP